MDVASHREGPGVPCRANTGRRALTSRLIRCRERIASACVRWQGLRMAVALATACVVIAPCAAQVAPSPKPRPYKILYVMSYHSPWRWTDGQLDGFKRGLNAAADYKVFQMDAKRHSTPEAKAQRGREARELIETWKPDLVYATDDDAQEHVTAHYVGRELPFVFSGVNKDPATYGFTGSRNVAGVLEQEHFVESVRLLRSVSPSIRRIAVVFDDASMWHPVAARMQRRMAELPDVEIVAWDTIGTFERYREKIASYPAIADAVALVGVFGFKDASGKNVPYERVLRWTAENSKLPDLSFWIDRVHFGTLVAVTVSEVEQGLAAGRLARAILVEGKQPTSLAMKPTVKGIPALSLARAKTLGIRTPSSVLLSAEVVERFDWDLTDK